MSKTNASGTEYSMPTAMIIDHRWRSLWSFRERNSPSETSNLVESALGISSDRFDRPLSTACDVHYAFTRTFFSPLKTMGESSLLTSLDVMPLYLMTFIFFLLQAATSRWSTFIPSPTDDTCHGSVLVAWFPRDDARHIRIGKGPSIEKRNIEKAKRARAHVWRSPRDPRNDVSLTVTARTPVNALTRARVFATKNHEDEGGERKSGRETERKRPQRIYKQPRVVVAPVVVVVIADSGSGNGGDTEARVADETGARNSLNVARVPSTARMRMRECVSSRQRFQSNCLANAALRGKRVAFLFRARVLLSFSLFLSPTPCRSSSLFLSHSLTPGSRAWLTPRARPIRAV